MEAGLCNLWNRRLSHIDLSGLCCFALRLGRFRRFAPAGSEEIPSEPLVVGGGRIVCVTGGVLLPPPVEGFTLIWLLIGVGGVIVEIDVVILLQIQLRV